MFIRVIFTALSFCAVFIVVSDNIPGWGECFGVELHLGYVGSGGNNIESRTAHGMV